MKIIVALILACATVGVAHARPLVVHESARLDNPDTSYPNSRRSAHSSAAM